MNWSERIKRLPPLVWLPVLLGIFFNKMAFSNLILARGDTFLYFYPYWEAAAAALKNGRYQTAPSPQPQRVPPGQIRADASNEQMQQN